jgi:23S rRNA G2445 N2-methylase RlmL
MEDANFGTTDSEEGSTFFGPLTEADTLAVEAAESAAPELTRKAFDSYMLLEDDLELGQHRLLEVDNSLVLPS